MMFNFKKYRLVDTWVAAVSAFACAVGIATLIGWQFRIPFLKAPFPASVTTFMAPNTALCFILTGVALWMLRDKDTSIWSTFLGRACAAFVFVFASLTSLEFLTGLDFRIDGLFFAHRLNDWTLHSPPGRFGSNTPIAFLLLALALLLLDRQWKEQPLSEILSMAAGLVAFLVLIGYSYGIPYLSVVNVGSTFVLRMATHTAITFLVLSTGVFFARREYGLAALLLARDVSGVVARRLLMTVIVVVPAIGWLWTKSAVAGIVDPAVGTVLLVGSTVAIFSVLTLDTARRLRKQNIEREYLEAMQLLASIIESSDDAIYTRSLDGTITSWNKGAERLFGYTAGEAIGQPLAHAMSPEQRYPEHHHEVSDQHEIRDLLQRISRGERIEHYESARVCKDGHVIDVSMTISPMRDTHGKITGGSAVVRDVTERKRAQKALEESEARFRNLVEASPDAIFVHSAGKIVFANPATLKLYGAKTPEQVIGKGVFDLVHPDYRSLIKQRAETDHRLGKASGPVESVRIRLDGSLVEVESIGIPITWQGAPAIEVVHRDITERKRAQQTALGVGKTPGVGRAGRALYWIMGVGCNFRCARLVGRGLSPDGIHEREFSLHSGRFSQSSSS